MGRGIGLHRWKRRIWCKFLWNAALVARERRRISQHPFDVRRSGCNPVATIARRPKDWWNFLLAELEQRKLKFTVVRRKFIDVEIEYDVLGHMSGPVDPVWYYQFPFSPLAVAVSGGALAS